MWRFWEEYNLIIIYLIMYFIFNEVTAYIKYFVHLLFKIAFYIELASS